MLRWQGRERGLLDIGYHLIIDRRGGLHLIRDLFSIGSHTPAYNHVSIGVCLIGGLGEDGKPADNFYRDQREALRLVALAFLREFPEGRVAGHKELTHYKGRSVCPALNVKDLRATLNERDIRRVRPLSQILQRKQDVAPSLNRDGLPQDGAEAHPTHRPRDPGHRLPDIPHSGASTVGGPDHGDLGG